MKLLFLLLLSLPLVKAQIMFPIAGGGAHGPTFTGKTCNAFNPNPTTCTWSSAPSAGETIHCTALGASGTVSSFAVTDNAGTPNTYAANGAAVGPSTSFSWTLRLFDTFNIANSPTTTTLTTVGTATGWAIQCISTTGSVGAAADGARGSATNTGTTNTVTIAPVAANDFGFCVSEGDGATTLGFSTSGWTIPAITNAGYKSALTAGSQSVVITSTASVGLVSICGTYK